MQYWFDTEFIENGKTIDLISVGIVAEDGRSYYAVSNEFKKRKASQWVKDNVFVHLPPRHAMPPPFGSPRLWEETLVWKSRKQIAKEIVAFVGENPEFWAYFADYDWVVLCQLYGTMMDIPKTWPYYCRDLKQLIDEKQAINLPSQENEHNALYDARWVRDAYEHVKKFY